MADSVAAAGPARVSALAPLRNPAFARLWFGAITSNIGTWMEAVALGIYVQRTTGEASWTASVAAAAFLPIAIFGPLGGALADHVSRKLVIVGTSLVQAALAASLATVFANGSPTPGLVTLIAFGSGVCAALGFPAFQAILPDLVPPEALPGAIALSSAQYNLGRVFGPVLAGIVIAGDRFFAAVTINAASFLVVVAVVLTLRLPRPVAQPERIGFLGTLAGGLRFVRGDPGLRVNVATLALSSFVAAPFIALIPTMAEEVLAAPDGTALLIAAQGVGAVAMAFAVGPIMARWGPRRLLFTTMSLLPLALSSYALAATLRTAAIAIVFVGACYLGALSTMTTVAQLRAPTELRGRVLAVHTVVLGSFYPVGAMIQGEVADAIGLPRTTVGAAALLATVLLITRAVRPGLARALDEPPALPSAP